MRSGTSNVKGTQKSGLLRKVASGLAKCRLDLMAAQDERYKDRPEQTKNYKRVCLKERGNEIFGWMYDFFIHKRLI